jgi:ABC-type transporter Mla subunit MlaD
MNNNQLNQTLQNLMQMKNMGRNPHQIIQMLIQRNPNYQRNIAQLKNMANGRNPQEFIMQLAKQQGVDENSINLIKNIMN